jgi:ABC-type transport system involved in multi-copper enzyme maturation permease subunit
MTRFIRLVGFFAKEQLSSGIALLLVALIVLLVLVGILTGARMLKDISQRAVQEFGTLAPSGPVVSVDVGSVHRQVWDATNMTLWGTHPVGILAPLRLTSRWLFIVLPFVGLLLSSRTISQELESGLAQSLYVSPVRPSTLGMARMVGDSLSTSLLIGVGMAVALGFGGWFVRLSITAEQFVRSVGFIAILGVYTSVFMLIGNLLSAKLRSSARSIWACVAVGILVFSGHLIGENAFIAVHRSYPTVPFPPREVNEFLFEHDMWSTGTVPTLEALTAYATPAVYRYLLELKAHAQAVFDMVEQDYRRERWYGVVSPVHAIWEIAGQLLQDRHVDATEIFAPVPPLNPPPSIGTSLQRAWPELLGMVVAWLALFGFNVLVLSRMEV